MNHLMKQKNNSEREILPGLHLVSSNVGCKFGTCAVETELPKLSYTQACRTIIHCYNQQERERERELP